MYRVLLPTDADEGRALAQAEATVGLPHAAEDVRAVVVHVFEDATAAEKTAVEQLPAGKQLVETLRSGGVEVATESRHGDPERQILNAAQEHDADVIVLGGRKRSPLGALVFGSVTQAVILDADRPVTVTGGSRVTA